jgi:hypothetical protein
LYAVGRTDREYEELIRWLHMYLLLFPLFGAVLYDRIRKLRLAVRRQRGDEIKTNSLLLGLIVLVGVILVLLIEGWQN